MPHPPFELAITRYIAASPETVWQIMSDRMEEWWAPKPWRTSVTKLDRFTGGVSRLVMHGPDGEENPHDGFVLAWDEGVRFSITDAIKPDLQPDGPFMLGIWSIEAEEAGTRYTACARHWSEESYKMHEEMGFEEGWMLVADQLAEICEAADK